MIGEQWTAEGMDGSGRYLIQGTNTSWSDHSGVSGHQYSPVGRAVDKVLVPTHLWTGGNMLCFAQPNLYLYVREKLNGAYFVVSAPPPYPGEINV
jgi:hypothetical protein